MKLQRYFPTIIGDQIVWLTNFKNKLPTHAPVLALDALVLAARLLDVATAIYALREYRGSVGNFPGAAYQQIEDVLHNPTVKGTVAWMSFSPPPGAPEPVAYGCLDRVFAFINDVIKKSPGYSRSIGVDLGVENPPVRTPDPLSVPDFELRLTVARKMEVVWPKGVFDGVKLEFDLGAEGRRTDLDLRPNYTLDWLPPAGQSAIIRVRLRYIYKGEDFGTWSAWKSFTLTGQ